VEILKVLHVLLSSMSTFVSSLVTTNERVYEQDYKQLVTPFGSGT